MSTLTKRNREWDTTSPDGERRRRNERDDGRYNNYERKSGCSENNETGGGNYDRTNGSVAEGGHERNGVSLGHDRNGGGSNYDRNSDVNNHDRSGGFSNNYDRSGSGSKYDRNGGSNSYDRNGGGSNFDRNGNGNNHQRSGSANNSDRNGGGGNNNYDRNGVGTNYDRNGGGNNYDRNGVGRNVERYSGSNNNDRSGGNNNSDSGSNERNSGGSGYHQDRYSHKHAQGPAPRSYENKGHDNSGYENRGNDNKGYDNKGYDNKGYDNRGHDSKGYDNDGLDNKGYDNKGYDNKGYDDCRGRDNRGYDNRGYDNKGYENKGYDNKCFNKSYDNKGYDKNYGNKDYNSKPYENKSHDRSYDTRNYDNKSNDKSYGNKGHEGVNRGYERKGSYDRNDHNNSVNFSNDRNKFNDRNNNGNGLHNRDGDRSWNDGRSGGNGRSDRADQHTSGGSFRRNERQSHSPPRSSNVRPFHTGSAPPRNNNYQGGFRSGGAKYQGNSGGGVARNPTEALSNLIPVIVSPTFVFTLYGISALDKDGNDIQQRRRRSEMFYTGLTTHLKSLKLEPSSEMAAIRRGIFFDGTCCYSSKPIPGLLAEDLPRIIHGDDAGIGDTLTITKGEEFTSPSELHVDAVHHSNYACGTCNKAFREEKALMAHCTSDTFATPHSPRNDTFIIKKEEEAIEDGPLGTRYPSTTQTFLTYTSNVLQKAMDEKLMRWGREYIDPVEFTEPKDKNNRSLGIRVFKAYSCDFGYNRTEGLGSAIQLTLTVDLKAKIMRTKNLLDSLCQQVGHRGSPDEIQWKSQDIMQARNQWNGEVVIAMYDKRCFSVIDLDFEHSAASLPVPGLGISHADYFEQKKGNKLQYPNASPMVSVAGRGGQTINLPPELVCGNDLDPMVKRELPKIASFTPEQRHIAIEQIKKFLVPGAHKSQGGGLLPIVGLTLRDERVKVPVEVISPPAIFLGGGSKVPNSSRGWTENANRATFRVNPTEATVMNVVVIFHVSLTRCVDAVYARIRDKVNSFSSKYQFPHEIYDKVQVGHDDDHWKGLDNYLREKKLPENIFVMDFTKPPNRSTTDNAYPLVKQILGEAGYLSQFINFNNKHHGECRNDNDLRKSNIILQGTSRQILSKCGARIWWVDIPKSLPTPAVFVGVDVYHAPRRFDPITHKNVGKSSIAAIVVQLIRSHDRSDNVEVYAETREQRAGQELGLGQQLHDTIRRGLQLFQVEPQSCILWRDGIGIESIKAASDDEVPKIRDALASMSLGRPDPVPLSYMICQKRIATKFISVDGKQMMPPGTLVRSLQSLNYETFYINGTCPPKSTAKPCRFIVSVKDDKLEDVELEKLTWSLCHDYSNWAGPVKLPSPVQNAHKLAEMTGGSPKSGETINYRSFVNKLFFL
eukprot:CAMPEP_0194279044 /NCGR_PEP_ID=MMETSP0169-20130528/13128_1 /TAXON_ID=218684 /ORGANISM="Corethron pennatum, Strain L29A3" /LENGTH=1387 /DNA_ID=CAMNT_0039023397 /DNA_START=21 /DNA_END=4184 /DNA_ORIENTATION=+